MWNISGIATASPDISHQVAAALGDTDIRLPCQVCASPALVRYIWSYADGTTVRNGIVTDEEMVLDIDNVKMEDFTIYQCKVYGFVNGTNYTEEFLIQLIEKGRFFWMSSYITKLSCKGIHS